MAKKRTKGMQRAKIRVYDPKKKITDLDELFKKATIEDLFGRGILAQIHSLHDREVVVTKKYNEYANGQCLHLSGKIILTGEETEKKMDRIALELRNGDMIPVGMLKLVASKRKPPKEKSHPRRIPSRHTKGGNHR